MLLCARLCCCVLTEGKKHYEGSHFRKGDAVENVSPPKAQQKPIESEPTAAKATASADSLPRGYVEVTPFGRPSSRAHTRAPHRNEAPPVEGRRRLQNTHVMLEGGEARAALEGVNYGHR